jgi:hypothetical protein
MTNEMTKIIQEARQLVAQGLGDDPSGVYYSGIVELADEIERLRGLLVPHVCLCGRTATVPPGEHGEQCPYRILCLQEKTP